MYVGCKVYVLLSSCDFINIYISRDQRKTMLILIHNFSQINVLRIEHLTVKYTFCENINIHIFAKMFLFLIENCLSARSIKSLAKDQFKYEGCPKIAYTFLFTVPILFRMKPGTKISITCRRYSIEILCMRRKY